MLKVHLADGQTLSFDLEDEEQASQWMRQVGADQFQRSITALTLVRDGAQVTLPRPRGLEPVFLFAECAHLNGRAKAAERIVCYAGDISITATTHTRQRAVRIGVTKSGRLRYNPLQRNRR